MKIKSKLYVLVSITLSLTLFIAISVSWAKWRIDDSLQQQRYATEILKCVSGLAYQFRNLTKLVNQNTKTNLEQAHQKLNTLLENPPTLDANLTVLLSSIKKNHRSIRALYEHLDLQNIPQRPAITSHLIEKSFNQIETIRDESFQLSSLASNKIQQVLNTQFFGIILVIIITGVFLIVISIWLYNGIIFSLSHLFSGLTATSSGNYDFQVAESGNDEISQISRLFNDMQTRLDKTTISKVNLELIVDKQTRKLKALVETDTLTLVPNRRAYTHRLNEEKALSIRNNSYLSMMMIDIDYFKQFNDGYGHEEGDIVLTRVAQTIQKSLPRNTDFVARYGGEEFVVLLPATTLEGASQVAERIASEIKKLNIEHKTSPDKNRLTLSIGIACLKGREQEKESLLKQADQAMYKAKNNGRNQYQLYNSTPID